MMTMTNPRKTSTETNRGLCTGGREVAVLSLIIVGALIAVTIPHLCELILIVYSYLVVTIETIWIEVRCQEDVKNQERRVEQVTLVSCLSELISEKNRIAEGLCGPIAK
jgi:hypothetical protein